MEHKQLIRKLKQLGVDIDKTRDKGRHQLAKYQDRQATIPVHGDADIGHQFVSNALQATRHQP
jgi:predicted RNA binding protein YcfA (HicA-like mRNA interferase family)